MCSTGFKSFAAGPKLNSEAGGGTLESATGRRFECGLLPEELFSKLRPLGFQVLLHSQSGNGWSYCVRGDRFRTATLDELAKITRRRPGLSHYKSVIPFSSGCVVILSYDLGRKFERIPDALPTRFAFPEILLLEAEEIFAFDHSINEWWYVGDRDIDGAGLGEVGPWTPDGYSLGAWIEAPSVREYCEAVLAAKEYIAAGDIYQVNIARWFSADFSGDAYGLYREIAAICPSPYGGFVDLAGVDGMPDSTIISVSPELLLYRRGDRIVTRPIAGTYPKSLSREELPRDPKERAEHVMLVDLERNDLGKVAAVGSVRVEEMLGVEEYSHLYHIVSQVGAYARDGIAASDLLRAIFPGGTITGTPKIRAMEIIDELESCRRGFYTGSMGYITKSGEMNLNILIRTALVQDGRIHLAAGSGIVADSSPEREAHETTVKAMAFLELCDESRKAIS